MPSAPKPCEGCGGPGRVRNRTGLCRACYLKRFTRVKACHCGTSIDERNKSGLCRKHYRGGPKHCRVCSTKLSSDNQTLLCRAHWLQDEEAQAAHYQHLSDRARRQLDHIPADKIEDYRIFRKHGYTAAEAAQMIGIPDGNSPAGADPAN
jgi:hypothetical protein